MGVFTEDSQLSINFMWLSSIQNDSSYTNKFYLLLIVTTIFLLSIAHCATWKAFIESYKERGIF